MAELKVVSKKDLAPIMKDVNKALLRIKVSPIKLTNHLAYSTAMAVGKEQNIKIKKPKPKLRSILKGKIRLEARIKKLSSDASN